MNNEIRDRAIRAASSAAHDAVAKGWWTHTVFVPVRFRAGNGWAICRSIPWTTQHGDQWVPTGMLTAAALRAVSRAMGVRPNHPIAIQIAIEAAAIAGNCDLSSFEKSQLIALRLQS